MSDGKRWAANARRFHAIEAADRALALASRLEEEARLRYVEAFNTLASLRELWSAVITIRSWASEDASRARFRHPPLGGRPYSDDYSPDELSR